LGTASGSRDERLRRHGAGILWGENTVEHSKDWDIQADEWLDQPLGEHPMRPEAPSPDGARPAKPLPSCAFCEQEAVMGIIWSAAPLPRDDVCVLHAELAVTKDQGRGALRIVW
jgi:hypothetical protein